MGVLFRSGDYIKYVVFGHRTIKDGEAAAIWNSHGELIEVVGPRRVTLWCSTIRFLYQFQATRGQYLKVEYRDGTTKHVVGPVGMYLNPTHHKTIQVVDGFDLATRDDCLVMYRHSGNTEKGPAADRIVLYGPQFVIPSEQEAVHTFQWSSGSCDNDRSSSTTSFQVLNTSNIEQWKMNLALKTQEGVVANIHIAISYKVATVEKCLEIADPISYVHAAILCDANRGDITVDNVSSLAGQIATYRSFQEAMDTCGFRVHKLYLLNVSLAETAAGGNEKDKLEQQERKRQRELALAQKQHELELCRLSFEMERAQAEERVSLLREESRWDCERAEQERELLTAAAEAENENEQRSNHTRLEYFQGLRDLGVDLTQVLCAYAAASSQPPRMAPSSRIGGLHQI